MRKNPNGAVTEKRLDTLVQKRFHPQTVSKLVGLPKKDKSHLGLHQLRSRKSLNELSTKELEAIIHSVKKDFLNY